MMDTQTYSVGFSCIDVTPPLGTFLAGFISRTSPACKIDNPLQATVTAIDDGSGPLIIVAIEWLGFYEQTTAVRQRIHEATGIEAERIFLGASHSHGGPCMREMDLRRHGPSIDHTFLNGVFARLATAAAEAVNKMRTARLGCGEAWCGLSGSRRTIDDAGKAQWKPTLDAPHDHTASFLVVENEGGVIQHLLFGYACHPTGVGNLPHIGGGYAGFAIDYLEAELGCGVGFLQGCGGDQKPYAPDENGDFRRLTVDESRELGRRLAQSVKREIGAKNMSYLSGPVDICSRQIMLKAMALPVEAYKTACSTGREYQRDWGMRYLAEVENGSLDSQEIPFEIQTITFGHSLAIVGLACEATVEYGLRLRRELGAFFEYVWPAGYTNNIIGYIPVKRQIPEGGYEVLNSNQCFQYLGPFVESTEDQIHTTVHEMLGIDSIHE